VARKNNFVVRSENAMKKHMNQQGFTLIELAVTLMIGMMVTAGAFYYKTEEWTTDQQVQVGAELDEIRSGLQGYVNTYSEDILKGNKALKNVNATTSITNINNLAKPTVDELKKLGLLHSSVAARNDYFNVAYTQLLVAKDKQGNSCSIPTTLQPTALPCTLLGYVHTSNPLTLKNTTNQLDRVAIGRVLNSKYGTGVVWTTKDSKGADVVVGRSGTTNPNSDLPNTEGLLAATFDGTSPYDYRYLMLNGGNKMAAPLDLNNNALTNVTTLAASGLATVGGITSKGDVDLTGHNIQGIRDLSASGRLNAASASITGAINGGATTVASLTSNGPVDLMGNSIQNIKDLGASGRLNAASASISGEITGGATTVASLTSNGAISGTKGNFNNGLVVSGDQIYAQSGATVSGGQLYANGGATVSGGQLYANGGATVASLTSNGLVDLMGNSIQGIRDLSASGRLNAASASITGAINGGATTVASLTSTGAISGTRGNFTNGLVVSGDQLLATNGATVSGTNSAGHGLSVLHGQIYAAQGATVSGSQLYAQAGATVSGGQLYTQAGATVSGGALVSNNGITVKGGGVIVDAGGLTVNAGGAYISGTNRDGDGLSVSEHLIVRNGAHILGNRPKEPGLSVLQGVAVYGTLDDDKGNKSNNGLTVFNGTTNANGGMIVRNDIEGKGVGLIVTSSTSLNGGTYIHNGAIIDGSALPGQPSLVVQGKTLLENDVNITGGDLSVASKGNQGGNASISGTLTAGKVVNKSQQCTTSTYYTQTPQYGCAIPGCPYGGGIIGYTSTPHSQTTCN
jgi:prepilin-type N-terminal cleavage/methylation domain-containing protein